MKYNCECCMFTSNSRYDYNAHLNTNKHVSKSSGLETDCLFCPHCLKGYNLRCSLYRHKKKCKSRPDAEPIKANREVAITNALTGIREIKSLITELKIKPNNTITTNNNNILTVNMFLAENAKLSFSFTDMIKKIVIDRKFCSSIYFDMNYSDRVGQEIKKQFDLLDVSNRPIHCVEGENAHQKVLQVHHENEWHSELEKDMYCGIVNASVASLEREYDGIGLGKYLHDMDREYIRQITKIYENDSKELKEKVIKRFKTSCRSMRQKFTLAQMIMQMAQIDRAQLDELRIEQSDNPL